MIVAPKLIGEVGTEMYILQMENAAIIRNNCNQMMEQIGFAVLIGLADAGYKKVIGEVLKEFKELFRNWV